MAKRLRPLRVRYRLQAEWSTVAENEALTSRIPQARQLLRPPGSCLVDNTILLNAMCDAVEINRTHTTSRSAYRVATEFPLAILYIRSF